MKEENVMNCEYSKNQSKKSKKKKNNKKIEV